MNNAENSNKEKWRDLSEAVSKRRDELAKWNDLHVKVYKHLGYFLSLFTPLLAALVTYLSTISNTIYASMSALLLTLLTVLGGVLKPSQRFLAAVQLSHELEEFKIDFEIDLIELREKKPPNLDAIYTALHRRNQQLSVVGEAMAMGTLSTTVPESKKKDSHGASRTA